MFGVLYERYANIQGHGAVAQEIYRGLVTGNDEHRNQLILLESIPVLFHLHQAACQIIAGMCTFLAWQGFDIIQELPDRVSALLCLSGDIYHDLRPSMEPLAVRYGNAWQIGNDHWPGKCLRFGIFAFRWVS